MTPSGLNCPSECRFQECFPGVVVCDRCGLGKTVGYVNPGKLQNYECVTAIAKLERKRYFTSLFQDHFKNLGTGNALDVGCGEGLLINELRLNGWDVNGIDTHNFSNVTTAKDIVFGDFLEMEISEKYDLVTFVHSLEHFSQPGRVLEKARSVLNPDGYFFIAVPNFGGTWSRTMGSNWHWLNLQDHYYHYTKCAIKKILTIHGIHIVTMTTWSAFTPSVVQMYFSEKGYFNTENLTLRPVKSLLFRFSKIIRTPTNWILDQLGQGAELRILAKLD